MPQYVPAAPGNADDVARPVASVRALLPLCLALLALATWYGLTELEPTGMARIWAVCGAVLTSLAIVWRPERPGGGRAVAAVAAACLPAVVVGGVAAGRPLGELVWLGLVNVATMWIVAVVYMWDGVADLWDGRGRPERLARRGGPPAADPPPVRPPRSWIPRTAPEAVWLMVALGVGVPIGVGLGGFPGLPLGLTDAHALSWGLARHYAVLAVAANCALPLFFRLPRVDHERSTRRWLPVWLLVTAVCLLLPYHLTQTPLSWLFVVPAVMAGLVMPVRGAACAGLVVALLSASVPYPAYPADLPLARVVPPQALVDLLLAFVSHVALLVAVFRRQAQALTGRLAAQAGAEAATADMLASVLATMSDGMCLTDRAGRIAMSNEALTSALRAPLPDLVTPAWLRGLDLRVVDAQAQDVRRVLDDERTRRFLRPRGGQVVDVALHVGADAAGRRYDVSSRAVHLAGERLTLVLIKDVTRETVRRHELEAFAGTVAHDLKGPLTALTGWMDAADEELRAGDVDSGRMALRRARDASARMRELIADYLAQAVSAGGELTLTQVALLDVVREVADVYRVRAGDAAGAPTFDLDVPHVLHADAALTRQLVANLIGNGVKYARPGEAAYIAVHSLDDAPGWAQVRVADKGRGLQPGDEERIFEGFTRSAKDADAVAGIGLGLALCQAIVARHGGWIRAESNEWGGATFRFTLPTVPTLPQAP